MLTYGEILDLVKCLSVQDRVRLCNDLVAYPHPCVEVEGTEEIISAEEIEESEAAWQDYLAGRDSGLSAIALKERFFGGDLG